MLPVRRLTRSEIHLSYEQRAGDLGLKFDPPIKDTYVYVDVIDARARQVNDNRVRNHGRLVEFQADAYNALTCLVFGDSYAVRLMPLVAEAFSRSYWAHSYFDYDLIRELEPDVVVTVAAERGMIVMQNDMEPGLRRLEQQKRASGDMLKPRVSAPDSVRINSRRPSQAPSHAVRGHRGRGGRRVSEERDVEALDLPAPVRDDKVVEGRDGRLFLANDANSVLAQHSGELLFDEAQLRGWRELLETRTEWLEAPGRAALLPDRAERPLRLSGHAARGCRDRPGAPGAPAARSPARAWVERARLVPAGGARRPPRACVPQDRLPLDRIRRIRRRRSVARRDPPHGAPRAPRPERLRLRGDPFHRGPRGEADTPGDIRLHTRRAPGESRPAGVRQPRQEHRQARRLRVRRGGRPRVPGLRRLVRDARTPVPGRELPQADVRAHGEPRSRAGAGARGPTWS